MKDIKSYVIGFLTCACLFLIMGQGNPSFDKQKGFYQMDTLSNGVDEVLVTIMDTRSGGLEFIFALDRQKYKKIRKN